MSVSRKFWASLLALSVAGVAFFAYRAAFGHEEPLGESPSAAEPAIANPQAVGEFLAGDFVLVRRVENLPKPVRDWFIERGGSRFTIANPGKDFIRTDVIYDSSLPMRKQIFAGVTDDKCFVHYEHGGFAAHSDLVLFKVISSTKADPTSQLICFDFGDEAIHDLDG